VEVATARPVIPQLDGVDRPRSFVTILVSVADESMARHLKAPTRLDILGGRSGGRMSPIPHLAGWSASTRPARGSLFLFE